MNTLIFFSLIPIIAVASFSWSWHRLLDFNSYRKPHIEGTILSFIIFTLGCIWYLFVQEDKAAGIAGIMYYFIAFLVILFVNGSILKSIFDKKVKKDQRL
ncbi:hypothetical protein [Bacillus sp. 2205SS5-2]|uniref:hypothetical protein n=1 Tax=Bacillus sp. 2205SS5-2 TaxID=3109031 RepID=UPI00300748F4